ncbi:hypothetical protein L210DRAFT_933952 [Boletus edulis BED1]|uniref:Uncharacterized protein n=1 Tax=Boletus edulis BED1 TaxID=1328754 RepID=A0AAD4GKH2_BOLED|nr:hypothetical protein L210DRAFT_933952 [Boletus edulis BED1]
MVAFPNLENYSNVWPVNDMIMMRLKYTSSRARRCEIKAAAGKGMCTHSSFRRYMKHSSFNPPQQLSHRDILSWIRTNPHNSYISLKVVVTIAQHGVGTKATVALEKDTIVAEVQLLAAGFLPWESVVIREMHLHNKTLDSDNMKLQKATMVTSTKLRSIQAPPKKTQDNKISHTNCHHPPPIVSAQPKCNVRD